MHKTWVFAWCELHDVSRSSRENDFLQYSIPLDLLTSERKRRWPWLVRFVCSGNYSFRTSHQILANGRLSYVLFACVTQIELTPRVCVFFSPFLNLSAIDAFAMFFLGRIAWWHFLIRKSKCAISQPLSFVSLSTCISKGLLLMRSGRYRCLAARYGCFAVRVCLNVPLWTQMRAAENLRPHILIYWYPDLQPGQPDILISWYPAWPTRYLGIQPGQYGQISKDSEAKTFKNAGKLTFCSWNLQNSRNSTSF